VLDGMTSGRPAAISRGLATSSCILRALRKKEKQIKEGKHTKNAHSWSPRILKVIKLECIYKSLLKIGARSLPLCLSRSQSLSLSLSLAATEAASAAREVLFSYLHQVYASATTTAPLSSSLLRIRISSILLRIRGSSSLLRIWSMNIPISIVYPPHHQSVTPAPHFVFRNLRDDEHPDLYVSKRQQTSACVSKRQRTSAYVSKRQHT
jgi:hypothetical protein